MQHLCVSARQHDKRGLYVLGMHLAEDFRKRHELPPVEYHTAKSTFGHYGLYQPPRRRALNSVGQVRLDLDRCKLPVLTPGFSWSYPGYKADVTPVGVVAHEMGHHVWRYMEGEDEEGLRAFQYHWNRARQGEAPVSSYEPTAEESFCEATKLFITNPDLLRRGRPLRWQLLTGCGFEPAHDTGWRDVLKHAHERLIAAAESWVQK